jgi:hypothetical protein
VTLLANPTLRLFIVEAGLVVAGAGIALLAIYLGSRRLSKQV